MNSGDRLGPYRILTKLGEGGMGEVYRARDERLARDVAIKILPRTFADDPGRRTRFDREARLLAALNHPNIAHIYGAEETAGSVAIVMELVEGEDLAARVRRGPLPWQEARPLVRQLAGGLDAAHERGIIHRDLKPANIRITADKTVKILDFGLAKAMGPADGLAQDPVESPTVTSPATHIGTIVGTAAYMAPEQATGRTVDKRADIWAFGVVVFEMLTGRSPFKAGSAVASLGLILSKDPDWSEIPFSVPAPIVELLKRCLAKEPRARLRDIGDAIPVLEADNGVTDVTSARPASRSGMLWMAAVAVALAAGAAGLAWAVKPSPSAPLRQLELPETLARAGMPSIAPDGRHLAYVSQGKVFVRSLAQTEVRELTPPQPTTSLLTWSPDSDALAYYAAGTIRTVPVSGGEVFTVASVPGTGSVNSILWHRDGTILFGADRGSLYRVAATGGTLEVLLELDPTSEVDFHEISAAPNGRLVIGVHQLGENLSRSELVEPGASPQRTVLVNDETVRDLRYAEPGRFLFLRLGANQGLWSLPFSEGPLDLSKATLIVPGATGFSVSTEGTLIARSAAPALSRLEWIGRDGSSASTPGDPIQELHPWTALSPQGDRVAYVAGRSSPVLMVRDLASGDDTRVSVDTGGPRLVLGPVFLLTHPGWLPGGNLLFYGRGMTERSQLVVQRADGVGEPSVLTSGSLGRVSADGRWFAWREDEGGIGRLRYALLDGDSLGDARTFVGTENADVASFDLSPDGMLLAYAARDSSRQSNIYLMEFPSGASRWQVTTSGGTFPRFSADGRELLFMTGSRTSAGELEGRLMVMPLARQPSVRLGVAKPLLSGAAMPTGFTPARDGRLLVARPVPEAAGRSRTVLIQNWPLLARTAEDQ